MGRASPKSNELLVRTVADLRRASREHEAAIWRDLAARLERPRSGWSEVNLSRVARHAAKGQVVAVPGVLLATGSLNFPVTVGAFRASAAARAKVEAAGGRVVDLLELAAEHPEGTGVRILG